MPTDADVADRLERVEGGARRLPPAPPQEADQLVEDLARHVASELRRAPLRVEHVRRVRLEVKVPAEQTRAEDRSAHLLLESIRLWQV